MQVQVVNLTISLQLTLIHLSSVYIVLLVTVVKDAISLNFRRYERCGLKKLYRFAMSSKTFLFYRSYLVSL